MNPLDELKEEEPTTLPIKPVVRNLAAMRGKFPTRRSYVITGIARVGETVNLVAQTGRGKSWWVYGMAASIAAGNKWLGRYQCQKGRVLIIDNELHEDELVFRLRTALTAMGLPPEVEEQIDYVCLRGQPASLNVIETIIEVYHPDHFRCVILDALYRSEEGDPNSNQMKTLTYNTIDKMAAMLNCVWVNIVHLSKGDQSGKAVVDLGAGGGAQARAADTHIGLYSHVDPNCVVMEAKVRSSPPLEPTTVRYKWPLWVADLDTQAIKEMPLNPQERGRLQKDAEDAILVHELLQAGFTTQTALHKQTGIGKGRITKLKRLAAEIANGKPPAEEGRR